MSEEITFDMGGETNTPEPTDTDLMMSHSSMVDKVAERDELSRQIEEFLSSGSKISCIDPNIMADPPKKPENRYGSHPI